jgi:hypothetical protein
MPRRLRIEFEGAIYQVTARGNGRQKIVRDSVDRRRLIEVLERTAIRHGWELSCDVIMGNHLHFLVKTARPNLGAGVQGFLFGSLGPTASDAARHGLHRERRAQVTRFFRSSAVGRGGRSANLSIQPIRPSASPCRDPHDAGREGIDGSR